MHFLPEPAHSHGTASRAGILIVNLGTPAEPTAKAVRRYLGEFLSDPRVVEIPRILWWPVLHGIILRVRPARTAHKYQRIWTKEGSPLLVYTQRQAQMLRGYLGESAGRAPLVEFAMRYGGPSIADAICRLKDEHCDRILVLPLYPQYASSTTGTVVDALGAALSRHRTVPATRVARSFHDHPSYIGAIADNVRAWWMKSGRPDFATGKLLMTFHGLPRFQLDAGDPYHCQCHKTARLIADRLGLDDDAWRLTFQSRFGRAEWLKPYTGETLSALGRAGVRRIDAICPGFAADCLETLEEIAIEGRDTFLAAGGKEFNYIPTTNDTEPWIGALATIALENLGGWLESAKMDDASQRELAASAKRALRLGAPR